MSDEYGNGSAAPAGGERVGFCQDCGKPLTQETVRTVGSGVFCEPCLEARVGASGQAASGYAVPPAGAVPGAGYGTVPPPPYSGHAPSLLLAGFLGMIPGVGAMYNGQYAKGLAHFAIFAILMSLSDGHSLFGLMAFGWFCYQIFDAYHTAKARLEGLPLPNPFGLNEIGERMGFGKNWTGSGPRPSAPPVPPPPVTPWAAGPVAAASPVAPIPPANWAGYVPPSAFATSPQVAAAPIEPPTQAAQGGSWGSSPYQAPYTAPYKPVQASAPVAPAAVVVPAKRFPAGAVWLIGLGLLFLLANIDPHFHLSGLWLSAAIFAGLSIWTVIHRMSQLHRAHPEGVTAAATLACLLRWPPAVLMVLAVLFALQAANLYTLGQTWPVIIIAFGAMLLIERSAGRTAYAMPAPVEQPIPTAAAWTPETSVPVAGDTVGGSPKEGQE